MQAYFIVRKIWGGQSLGRILMNVGFRGLPLRGVVVDVGGGRSPDYFEYFDTKNVVSIVAVDGSISKINFEKDSLPYSNGSIDTAVCANVLEHIYEHRHLVAEIYRILKPDGELIGFVPFLVQYHPDPHDYFRYTKEALARIFAGAGFRSIRIEIVGGGPFAANFSNIMLSMPRFIAAPLFLVYWPLDRLFLTLRPAARERYPLGFIFSMKK